MSKCCHRHPLPSNCNSVCKSHSQRSSRSTERQPHDNTVSPCNCPTSRSTWTRPTCRRSSQSSARPESNSASEAPPGCTSSTRSERKSPCTGRSMGSGGSTACCSQRNNAPARNCPLHGHTSSRPNSPATSNEGRQVGKTKAANRRPSCPHRARTPVCKCRRCCSSGSIACPAPSNTPSASNCSQLPNTASPCRAPGRRSFCMTKVLQKSRPKGLGPERTRACTRPSSRPWRNTGTLQRCSKPTSSNCRSHRGLGTRAPSLSALRSW
mmetsp:Transcript_118145/g.330830  ORF Transcript_118145/g.330830 Transcript_118145/m.330830 type:complete len:267 (+) Transcript_118145:935-1735(+)